MALHDNLPYFSEGEVVSGFGRGSKELGIPTANFPESVIKDLPASFSCGVYYGWAKLSSSPDVFKMTMCVGWNPYYHNTVKTMETHIIHQFDADFYGDIMKIIVLGYIRPMCDFSSLDGLIKAIHNDIEVASKNLDTAESLCYKSHQFFQSSQTSDEHKDGAVESCRVSDDTSQSASTSERLCPSTDQTNPAVSVRLKDHNDSIPVKSCQQLEKSHIPYDINCAAKNDIDSQKLALSNGDCTSCDNKLKNSI